MFFFYITVQSGIRETVENNGFLRFETVENNGFLRFESGKGAK